jgi:hypothetical protein
VREKREEIGSYESISIQQSSYGFFNFKQKNVKAKEKATKGKKKYRLSHDTYIVKGC